MIFEYNPVSFIYFWYLSTIRIYKIFLKQLFFMYNCEIIILFLLTKQASSSYARYKIFLESYFYGIFIF